MKNFNELGIQNEILNAVKDLGFQDPMPVQEKVIPLAIDGINRDITALAQTGTGKTAAFGIPLIQNTNGSAGHVQYLILSPTRELCLQIADDLVDLASYRKDVKIAAVFGGASIEHQIRQIKQGVHIISATPGRLLDLINRRAVNISKIKAVVLDEADEMLNMGFRDELEAILSSTPDDKHTLLFSATMPKEVQSIAERFQNDPVKITVGKKNAGAENVNHLVYFVQARDRYIALKRIVDYNPDIYGIVFCRTRKETQEVADLLMKDGYNADSLHGDLSQAQRDIVMNRFRIRHLKLLVATDVAARGLDVNCLTHVINYNLPDDNEIYTHRSGRTGRAGKSGTSIVVANLREKRKIQDIEKQLGKKFEVTNIPNGDEICEKQLFHLIDRMEKVEVDDTQIESYLPAIFKKLEWLDREELIKKFVSVEFNRFLEYYRDSTDINVSHNKGRGSREKNGNAEFTRFFINLGKMDNITPVNIIGMINDYTNVRNIEIGDIEILKTFSFFEAEKAYEKEILEGFNGKSRKNRKVSVEIAESKSRSKGKSKRSFTPSLPEKKDRFEKSGNRTRNSDRDRNRKRRSKNDIPENWYEDRKPASSGGKAKSKARKKEIFTKKGKRQKK